MRRWWRALTPVGKVIMLTLSTLLAWAMLNLAGTAFEAVMAPGPRPVERAGELEPHATDADAPKPWPDGWLIVPPQAEILEP